MKPMTKYPLTLDKTTRLTSPSLARREDGVALAVSLVLLIVLTVLGISALTMTGQEEKMSGNFQDMTRSFQVAESGLVDAFTGQFSLTQTVLGTVTGSQTDVEADHATDFSQFTKPRRGSGYSALNFSSAHFETESVGKSGNATTLLNQGAYQITPKL